MHTSESGNGGSSWAKYIVAPIILAVLTTVFEEIKSSGILDTSHFQAHGMCFAWQPGIVWTHAISDGTIAFSYFIIPLLLVKSPIRKIFPFVIRVCFAIFILGCGMTHVMDVFNIWTHAYWLDAGFRILTAIASLGTVAYLLFILQKMTMREMIEQMKARPESES